MTDYSFWQSAQKAHWYKRYELTSDFYGDVCFIMVYYTNKDHSAWYDYMCRHYDSIFGEVRDLHCYDDILMSIL